VSHPIRDGLGYMCSYHAPTLPFPILVRIEGMKRTVTFRRFRPVEEANARLRFLTLMQDLLEDFRMRLVKVKERFDHYHKDFLDFFPFDPGPVR
jgi:hypothetical protein